MLAQVLISIPTDVFSAVQDEHDLNNQTMRGLSEVTPLTEAAMTMPSRREHAGPTPSEANVYFTYKSKDKSIT